jgi:hypothetical protein
MREFSFFCRRDDLHRADVGARTAPGAGFWINFYCHENTPVLTVLSMGKYMHQKVFCNIVSNYKVLQEIA